MQVEQLKKIISEVQQLKSEKQTVELKETSRGFPKRIYDTLSAFSNQDMGGVMIFGISDRPDFHIAGVYDAEDVQKKIMEHCQQMFPPVRAVITMCEIDGKKVVAAEIPSVEMFQRPVYYAGAGITKGSFVRVGDGDRQMTPYEIYSYEAFRKQKRDELRTVEHLKIDLFDRERLAVYLNAVKKDRKNLANNVSDHEIMELMGVMRDDLPTLAGTMVFSRYPQTYFPQLSITATVLPGIEMGMTGKDGERFIDNKRMTGPVTDMLEETLDFILRNSRVKTIIGEDGQRHDKTEYPMKAVREAVLNALIHRDYSIYTEGIPISVEMYRDRLEIKNSGGLYGYATLEDLGKTRPETRNPVLANMLELLKVTENRYSGIPTMIAEARKAGLPDPEFSQFRGEFKVTFRNNIFETNEAGAMVFGRTPNYVVGHKQKEKNLQRKTGEKKSDRIRRSVLEFCQTPRTREELTAYFQMTWYHLQNKYIQPLIEENLMAYTIPETPKSHQQRFKTICRTSY